MRAFITREQYDRELKRIITLRDAGFDVDVHIVVATLKGFIVQWNCSANHAWDRAKNTVSWSKGPFPKPALQLEQREIDLYEELSWVA